MEPKPEMNLRTDSSTASHTEVRLKGRHQTQEHFMPSSNPCCSHFAVGCQSYGANTCGRAYQVQDDVSSAHEGSSFQGAIRAQQHHMLKALLGEELPGYIVIASHYPQRIGLRPLWHPAFTVRAFTHAVNCIKAQALQGKMLCCTPDISNRFPCSKTEC